MTQQILTITDPYPEALISHLVTKDPKLYEALTKRIKINIGTDDVTSGNSIDLYINGAKGDYFGVEGTNDGPILQRAIDAIMAIGGGTIIAPITPARGEYLIDQRINVISGHGITFKGISRTFDYGSSDEIQPGAMALRDVGNYFYFKQCSFINFDGWSFDCRGIATHAIYIDRIIGGIWNNLSVVRCPGTAITFTVSVTVTGNDLCSYVTVNNLSTEVCSTGVELSGTSTSGCYMITFNAPRIGFYGTAGIRHINCDNIHVNDGFFYKEAGSGFGVTWEDDGSGNIPNDIYYLNLQASTGGIDWDVNVVSPGAITNYGKDNGEPEPTGFPGTITESGPGNKGWHTTALWPGTLASGTQWECYLAAGTGVPSPSDGLDHNFYFRKESSGLSTIYHRDGSIQRPAHIADIVDIIGNHVDISPTNFANCSENGKYRVSVYATTTTADAGAGNVNINITYNDGVGVFTQTKILVLNTTTRASEDFIVYQASGASISYATVLASGAYGAARCNFHFTFTREG